MNLLEVLVEIRDTHSNNNLDSEWLRLIIQAKELGMSIEDIRIFFANTNK
jgi:DNA-binding transcriptional MerR regulator